MFSWLGDILSGLGDALGITFENTFTQMADAIWTEMMRWLYNAIYDGMANTFTGINHMGAEIFSLGWVNAVIDLFVLLGWALFVVGVVMAVFDLAIESQTGRTSIKTTALNVLKGFFACSLIGVLPVELYKFCVSLQNSFSHELVRVFSGTLQDTFGGLLMEIMDIVFMPSNPTTTSNILKETVILIAFCYCIIKIFFANIKRGGIILIQIAVGSLYMLSLPRGYADGFWQWCKQVVAICLTSFLQTTLLFLGLITFQTHLLLGLGVIMAAAEVPRIAQQFGLDSSVRINVSSIVHTANTAVSIGRMLAKAK